MLRVLIVDKRNAALLAKLLKNNEGLADKRGAYLARSWFNNLVVFKGNKVKLLKSVRLVRAVPSGRNRIKCVIDIF